MNNLYLVLAGIAACLLFSNFFSMTEMCYSSCNTRRLENLAELGSRRAKVACYITEHFDNALSAILIGNNLANIGGSSLASVFMILLLGGEKAEQFTWVATLVMTILVIIIGETIPKILAKKNANRFALKWAYVIRVLMIILYPVIWLVVGLIKLITMPLKGNTEIGSEEAVEEFQNIIDTAEDENVIDGDQSELIHSAIDFSDTEASEVMTARVDVCAIDIDDDWDEIIKAVEEAPYTRIPVYKDGIDNIVGILYLNQFLKAVADNNGHADIEPLLMKPVYVYKTMKLPLVLNKLRKAKQHLAVVSDEYGGTLGVISMEDVLEEIVGEIWDENETIEEEVIERSEGEFEVDGDMSIYDFLELVDIREEDFDYHSDTVGGWTVEMLDEFPKSGDAFTYEDIKVSILAVDGRRVERVLIKLP